MEILIRPWRLDDLPAVRRILWETWMAAYRDFIPEEDLRSYHTATYRIESLTSLYESPVVHGFIGEADGAAVGFARTQFHLNENRLYLASLYLLPAFQGRGIGGRLLRVVEKRARDNGLEELWVGVMVQNKAARRWYDKRGFRFVMEKPFRMGGATVPHRIGYKVIGELERRCFAAFDGKGGSTSLLELADALLERQKKNWPGLVDGYATLSAARTREIHGDGWRVRVQFNPRRIVSSGAKLDPESIRRRPCFLCRENLPLEQEAIGYREDYLILCNPAPIFPGHRTIAHIGHLPQSLPDHLGIFLQLAADFGPRMIVFYNGPFAGASAPDHLHFQAAPAGLMPVEKEILDPRKRVGTKRRDGVQISQAAGLGRGILVIDGKIEEGVAAAAGHAIRALGCLTSADGEPPLNMLCTYTKEGWRLILFPRRKHRPDAYFREGRERLLISPGAADMGGVIITPREEDFLALTPDLVSGIFREVAFDDTATAALLSLLTGKRRPS